MKFKYRYLRGAENCRKLDGTIIDIHRIVGKSTYNELRFQLDNKILIDQDELVIETQEQINFLRIAEAKQRILGE